MYTLCICMVNKYIFKQKTALDYYKIHVGNETTSFKYVEHTVIKRQKIQTKMANSCYITCVKRVGFFTACSKLIFILCLLYVFDTMFLPLSGK